MPGAGSILYFVGFSSDAQQARVLTASLQIQAMVAMRAWWLTVRDGYRWHSESEKRRARSGFIRGFAAGAGERIEASRSRIVAESGSGTELVLASRRDRVDAAIHAMGVGRARRRQGADGFAFLSGRDSGREATTSGSRPLSRGIE